VKPETPAGDHEGAWHPAGFETKESAACTNRILNLRSISHQCSFAVNADFWLLIVCTFTAISIQQSTINNFGIRPRTIQLGQRHRQARAASAPPFHSSKRAAAGLPTVNSITTLLFWDNVGIGDGAATAPWMLRRAKCATEEHGQTRM